MGPVRKGPMVEEVFELSLNNQGDVSSVPQRNRLEGEEHSRQTEQFY